MSGFSPKQLRQLRRKLVRRHVHTRETEGRSISYIEGWFAVSQANTIFGFSGWDREIMHFERVYERNKSDGTSCSYLVRVRIRVRAGCTIILREGTGLGSASSKTSAEAHERALKSAETDGTKRALATFGNQFGLCLYDKGQVGVTGEYTPRSSGPFIVHDENGAIFADELSPESFCGALRQMLQKIHDLPTLERLWSANSAEIERLRGAHPKLKTPKGEHYSDVLARLLTEQMAIASPLSSSVSQAAVLVPLNPSRIAPGGRIDKSLLMIGTERRLRDPAHLKSVAKRACLACDRAPSHAHHLTFAQPRGLSLKVSDEFTVPLCAVHHDACHRFGDERGWWEGRGYDPLPIAAALWTDSRRGESTTDVGAIAEVLEQIPANGEVSDLASSDGDIVTCTQSIAPRTDMTSDANEVATPAYSQ
jgi:DNA recombination protein Rad52